MLLLQLQRQSRLEKLEVDVEEKKALILGKRTRLDEELASKPETVRE